MMLTIEMVKECGASARRSGMARGACPPFVLDAMRDAWLEGYDGAYSVPVLGEDGPLLVDPVPNAATD